MIKQVRGMKSPTTLRHVLPIAAVLLLFALVFTAPVAAGTATTAEELATALAGTANGNIVTLGSEVVLTNSIVITLPENGEVTILGNGNTIKRNFNDGFLIQVTSGKVTLGDADGEDSLTIDGNSATYPEATHGLIGVTGANSELVMNTGVTVTNSKVKSVGGDFSDTNGGGISVYNGASFTLNGGTISKNEASASGGGVFVWDASMTMNGGSITENKANQGAGVYFPGTEGGTNDATRNVFLMTDGTITKNIDTNTATPSGGDGGGVKIEAGVTFTMEKGTISENYSPRGSGVRVAGTFVMKDGSIINNGKLADGTVSSDGGGLYVNGGTFTMEKGTISGNSAMMGAGVYLDMSGQFTMNDGTITNNKATIYDGGGVYLKENIYDGTSKFTMNGGTISGNTAPNGAGVYLEGDGMNDGTKSEFIMSGSATVSDEVFLSSYYEESFIILEGNTFTGGASIITGSKVGGTNGIDVADTLEAGHSVVKIADTSSIKVSEVIGQFGLKNVYTAYDLISTVDEKGIVTTNMPLVKDSSVTVEKYNSTVATLSLSLREKIAATSITVTFSDTDATAATEPVTKEITAEEIINSAVSDYQIDGLDGGKTYTVTITPQNSGVNGGTPNTYTTTHTSPAIGSVAVTKDGVELTDGITLGYGESVTLAYTVVDGAGEELPGEPVTWTAAPADAVSITENGNTVTLKAENVAQETTVTVTATPDNDSNKAKEITVTVQKPIISTLVFSEAKVVKLFDTEPTATLTLTATDAANEVKNDETITLILPEGLTASENPVTGQEITFTAEKAGTYEVTAKCGGQTAEATLIFVGTPTVTNPEGKTYVQGQTANALSVTVTPSNDGATLTYQWYQSTTGDFSDAETVGANSAEYTPDIANLGTAYYRVEVTQTVEEQTTTAVTDAAKISVVEPTVDQLTINPTATAYTLYSGDKAEITATAKNSTVGTAFTALWKIESGEDIVEIAQTNGKVTITEKGKAGNAVLNVTAGDLKQTVTVNVIVTEAVPDLPIIGNPEPDANGVSTITTTKPISYSGNTATIAGEAVTLKVTFETLDVSNPTQAKGTVESAVAEYKPLGVETTTGVAATFTLTVNLANTTLDLPTLSANLDQAVKTAVEGEDLVPFAMVSATQNADAIAEHLAKTGDRVVIVFTVPTAWVDGYDQIWRFHYKGNQIIDQEPIDENSIQKNGAVTTITLKVDGFSTHGIAGKTVTSNGNGGNGGNPNTGGSSTSQGSSVWLQEPVTPTETPTTQPTDVAPTTVPTTQPTPTETESSGFGVLAVLAGLGAVAVLRRK